MKHLLIAFLILALCLGFCIWSCFYVRGVISPVLDTLRLARVHALEGNFSAAHDAVEQAGEVWGGHESIFGVLLRHAETDEIQCSFSALREYAATRDADDFSAACAELIVRLQHLRGMQLPTAANIF